MLGKIEGRRRRGRQRMRWLDRAVIIPYAPNLSLFTKEWDMHKLIDAKLDCEFCEQGAFFKLPQHLAYF